MDPAKIMNKYDLYAAIAELKKARVDKNLSTEQVSATLGRPPEFFDEFCDNNESFEMKDYFSICRVLGVKPKFKKEFDR